MQITKFVALGCSLIVLTGIISASIVLANAEDESQPKSAEENVTEPQKQCLERMEVKVKGEPVGDDTRETYELRRKQLGWEPLYLDEQLYHYPALEFKSEDSVVTVEGYGLADDVAFVSVKVGDLNDNSLLVK